MQPPIRSLRSLIGYFLKPYKWYFLAMALLRVVSAALDAVAVSHVIKLLLDRFEELIHERTALWSKVGGHFVAFWIILVLIEFLFRLFDCIKVYVLPNFEANIRMWIVHYLQGHSYHFFTKHFSGDLVKRIDDVTDGISKVVMVCITSLGPTFATILAGIGYCAYIQPLLGLVLWGWLSLHAILYIVYAKKYNYHMMIHAEKVSLLCGSMVDGLINILNIKLFSGNDLSHLMIPQAAEKKAHRKALATITYFQCMASGLFIIFMGIGLPCMVVYYWQLGRLTLTQVVALFNVGMNICNSVWSSMRDVSDYFEEVGYCKQAIQLLLQRHAIVDLPEAKPLHCSVATIVFKGVYFSYHRAVPFFENQNISIAAGEKVGVVGLSGSGKTTFVHLLLRFFDPQKGKITINGQNIATVTQRSLHAAVAWIPQDTLLFNQSILENIRYGRKEATDQEVIRSAQQAKCHDFLMRLPKGYHTIVGERGAQLSGGQRQRIAIARAILKNAPILILDEATSALDAVTEADIQENLAAVMADKTTIVITHRFAFLATLDRIFLFDQGKIIAQGSHKELLAANQLYRAMYTLQSEHMRYLQ